MNINKRHPPARHLQHLGVSAVVYQIVISVDHPVPFVEQDHPQCRSNNFIAELPVDEEIGSYLSVTVQSLASKFPSKLID